VTVTFMLDAAHTKIVRTALAVYAGRLRAQADYMAQMVRSPDGIPFRAEWITQALNDARKAEDLIGTFRAST
jgi:hypothetical protein